MKRRDFISKGIVGGIAAGSLLSIPGFYSKAIARPSSVQKTDYDLVAIKNGEPEVMFDSAIKELGGIGKFVKKGQSVVIKPNIGWDVVPEKAANTNPKLIKRIVEHCFNAGAKDVYVFDHTCDDWKRCYSSSEIEKYAKDAGAKVVPGNTESYYQEVKIPKGKSLKKDKVHELILSSDVFINVPVLKSHGSARLTISMKNLMGIVWDRGYWHRNNLQQCIADFPTFRKPDLNIVDAYSVMKQNGPRGVSLADVVVMKSQIISTDIVAADAAAAKLFGIEPADIPHIQNAFELGLGNIDLSKLNIKRLVV